MEYVTFPSLSHCGIRDTVLIALRGRKAVNLVLMTLDSRFKLLPSLWIWFVLCVYEGLLAGATYGKTAPLPFYRDTLLSLFSSF